MTFEAIVGQSPAIPGVCEIVPRVAAGDSTVLIQGDSGTGHAILEAPQRYGTSLQGKRLAPWASAWRRSTAG